MSTTLDELGDNQVNEQFQQTVLDLRKEVASTPLGRAALASVKLLILLTLETMGLARDRGLEERHVQRLWDEFSRTSPHAIHSLHALQKSEGTVTEYMSLAALLGFELEIELKLDPSSIDGYRVTVRAAPL
jgi:hypothetical protein